MLPLERTLAQLDDPAFLGTALRSLGWTVLAFVALIALAAWGGQALLADLGGWWSWLGALTGGLGAAVLAVLLFLPAAALIATLFIDPVAAAVERRYYPGLPPAIPASLAVQTWDGLALGLRVLFWQLVALLLALALPGVGLLLGWAIAAWAIGRGLFVAVAMRRMTRRAAQAEYLARRPAVLFQGAVFAALSFVPLFNLLLPLLASAALVHVLHVPERATRV